MRDELQDEGDVAAWLAANVWHPHPDDPVVGRVGLEAELFPFWVARDGRPAARLALVELMAIVDGMADTSRRPDSAGGRPSWDLEGALVTEEPGAQLEIAGPPQPDADTAITHLEGLATRFEDAFEQEGAALAACGLDLWSEPAEVPVQLEVPRYDVMRTYFGRRGGEHGHLLMCASASLQINVDLGPPAVARDRWLLANLAAPALIAAFAASPTSDGVNGRALGWRGLDPTRTGIPSPLVAGSDDVLEHVLTDVLRADVMMVLREGEWSAGWPGWSFGAWLEGDDRGFGPPRHEDLRLHLTTLFPEARLRGYLEVRGVDELPAPWRAAAVALVCGLLYDTDAGAAALEHLAPYRAQLPDLLAGAATDGLGDPTIDAVTRTPLELALSGARRIAPQHADVAEAYLDRFTRRGRSPSDELAERVVQGPAATLSWARGR